MMKKIPNLIISFVFFSLIIISCAPPPPDIFSYPCFQEPDYYINPDISDSSAVVEDFDIPPKIIAGPNSNVRYPVPARRAGISGTVRAEVIISKDDNVQEIRILETPGYCLEQEAIRAILAASFKSAIKDGKPVKSKLLQPINFNLQ